MGRFRRLLNLVRSNRLSTDIDREMAFHLAERTDDLVAHGMSEAEARREARRRFGNASVQKERTRDADVATWLESIAADVRYALRSLRASPVFAVVTIASLGLGIGANTAIFSLVNAVVLKTLPVPDPDELVQVALGESEFASWFTNPIWEQIRDRQDVFSGVFAYGGTRFNLTSGGETRRALGNWVSGDYFSTLGVQAAAGRLLSRSDDHRGCPPVAVLGYGFWQSEYGGAASAVGKSILLDRTPHTIVGVSEPSFFGMEVGRVSQVYIPLCLNRSLDARSTWFLNIVGRRKPGVTTPQVVSRLRALAPAVYEATVPQQWGAKEQAEYRTNTLTVRAAGTGMSEVRQQYQRALTVLMAVVGLVLLIACANVANLLLARAATRGREVAIRLAIGASRRRLVRQLLTESVLLAGMGAAVGVLFARWGSALLVRTLSGGPFPVWLDLGLDGRVLAFTVGIALLTGILFGLAPAWRGTRVDPQVALKANGRGVVEGHSRFTVGKALVIGQVALSLMLIVAAGLLLGSFRNLTTLDPGFRRDGVLIVSTNLRNAGYQEASYGAVQRDLMERFRSLPGVRNASASMFTPISGTSWNDVIAVDGYTAATMDESLAYFNQVSDGYFATMGTPFRAGRDFDARDRPGAPPVAIVNETMARTFFKGTSPLGRSYRLKVHGKLGPPIEIVGVVADAKYRSLREETLPTVYLPASQDTAAGPYLDYELQTAGPPGDLVPVVKAAVAEVNGGIALDLTTLATQVDASLTRDRMLALLSTFFGSLALLLATIGLYGTLSYSVARRRNELGIRIALGAERSRVMRLVLGEVARILLLGVLVGAIGALATTRWVASLLYGLSPSDARTLGASALVLAIVGLAAGAVPAWRAARVDPLSALREE